MVSINDQMTEIYCFIDDYVKSNPSIAQWRSSPNDEPALSDAEVITLGLMQGVLGCATLKRAYQIIAGDYASAFPHLCSYKQWIARLHALTPLVGRLIQAALLAYNVRFYLIDGKPIPVCKPIRHGRVRLMREDGAYFGKGSTGWFFGFKLVVLAHISGQIVCALLVPANWNEQDVAVALASSIDGGVALADLGYRNQKLANQLYDEDGLLVITPADATDRKALISSLRERIETSFSALWDRFVDRVYSRSWNGLWNTIKLKMLHFNLCQAGVISA